MVTKENQRFLLVYKVMNDIVILIRPGMNGEYLSRESNNLKNIVVKLPK
jgi:hypothetical protein